VGPGEGVKPRLSQALTRGARPDSNSRPAVQISNPLPSRYAPWGPDFRCLLTLNNDSLKPFTQRLKLFCFGGGGGKDCNLFNHYNNFF